MILEIVISASATLTFIPLIKKLADYKKRNDSLAEQLKEKGRQLREANEINDEIVNSKHEQKKVIFDMSQIAKKSYKLNYQSSKDYLTYDSNDKAKAWDNYKKERLLERIKEIENFDGEKLIFHAGCMGCQSPKIYGPSRCYDCQYFLAEWSKPDRSIY